MKNFKLSLSEFFFRIYITAGISVTATLINIYGIKYYLIPKLTSFNYINIHTFYIIQLISLGLLIFFSNKLTKMVDSINKNKIAIYFLFALLCIIQSFLFCPIFIIANDKILKIAINYSIILFIIFSIIGIMLEKNLNKITKLLYGISMIICLYLFFANFFLTISLNQLLIISTIFLISGLFMLITTTQQLKNLYYSNTDLDGLIIIGAFIIQQEFFNILINVIRIILTIIKKNED